MKLPAGASPASFRTISGAAIAASASAARPGLPSADAAKLALSTLGHPIHAPCAQDASTLRTTLQSYPGLFSSRDLDGLIDEIQARKREVDALSVRDRIETGVHGKEFFKEAIALALNSASGQASADAWRNRIAGTWKDRWPMYLVNFARRLVN